MEVEAHVFREYDIRGIVGVDFSPDLVREVGRAYGTALRQAPAHVGVNGQPPRVAVGNDNRPSSPELAAAMVEGLRSAGVTALLLGTVPTPVAYWSESALDTDGVIQITGSHNPPEWNGIKLTLGGRPFYGEDIQGLRQRIEEGDYFTGSGEERAEPVLDRYVDDLAGRIELVRPVRAVVDCGNGVGAVVAVRLLERIGVQVTPLFCESDGTFPNHHPDPTVDENLEDLIRTVRETGSEVGIAFDGDADRIGVVDDRGRIVRGDILLLLFGLDLIARRGPGHLLIHDVKCSQLVSDLYEEAGGRSLMWKTGHSLIKEKMRETGALLGGELSGHICFADEFIGSDDALYAACRLVRMIAELPGSFSEHVAGIPAFASTPEIRIEVTEESKTRIVRDAVEYFRSRHDVVDVDGVRILFGDGWGLLRSSNTQPVIVARFEARTPERLTEIQAEVMDWLATQGVHV